MFEAFNKQCYHNPDIRSYVVFDEHRLMAAKGDSELHDAFVAIQQLAMNIGRELGVTQFINATFIGESDQYIFRTIGTDEVGIFAVFCASIKVDLENLVEMLHTEALSTTRSEMQTEATQEVSAEAGAQPELNPGTRSKTKLTYRGSTYDKQKS